SWIKVLFDDRHIRDTLNETHPPFYDGTDEYDLLIVRALCPDCYAHAPSTRPVAFIITPHALISIRPPNDSTFFKLHKRFLSSSRKIPDSIPMLLYMLIDGILDGLLSQRERVSDVLNDWQERLLDRNDAFSDWQSMMHLRGQLRRLEVVTESQMEALLEWREQTLITMDSAMLVRFNDLQEHLKRIYNHATVIQHDIDSLVQVYFSANTQRTNEILQFLAVISAIFLPLNLAAGFFGMNFIHLPMLQSWYGPWIVGTIMLTQIAGLYWWFRRRGWV
ncbi:MAG: magnesium transporter CorA family protein, partial [Candidatus Thiodiazotropha sp.]